MHMSTHEHARSHARAAALAPPRAGPPGAAAAHVPLTQPRPRHAPAPRQFQPGLLLAVLRQRPRWQRWWWRRRRRRPCIPNRGACQRHQEAARAGRRRVAAGGCGQKQQGGRKRGERGVRCPLPPDLPIPCAVSPLITELRLGPAAPLWVVLASLHGFASLLLLPSLPTPYFLQSRAAWPCCAASGGFVPCLLPSAVSQLPLPPIPFSPAEPKLGPAGSGIAGLRRKGRRGTAPAAAAQCHPRGACLPIRQNGERTRA